MDMQRNVRSVDKSGAWISLQIDLGSRRELQRAKRRITGDVRVVYIALQLGRDLPLMGFIVEVDFWPLPFFFVSEEDVNFIMAYLPIYTLFQSDRKNSDGDSEVQDPLKEAVKEILADEILRTKLNEVASEVEAKLNQVASRTLAKLTEISPQIASSLSPVIPSSDSLKWTDVFKNVSIASDNNIPINKRGSGTKRLILLSFFRAEAERRISGENSRSVIYAIEEPETSQHAENQRVLIHAFQTLSTAPNTQVIITTHSAIIVKELAFDNLRLVVDSGDGKTISSVNPGQLPYPSLNEVNYLAFSEVSEEYHNELYGYIEECGKLGAYKAGKAEMPYIKVWQREQRLQPMNVVLSEYIRHQIHHPENHYKNAVSK